MNERLTCKATEIQIVDITYQLKSSKCIYNMSIVPSILKITCSSKSEYINKAKYDIQYDFGFKFWYKCVRDFYARDICIGDFLTFSASPGVPPV